MTLTLPPSTLTVPDWPALPLTENEPSNGGLIVPVVPFGAVTSIWSLPAES